MPTELIRKQFLLTEAENKQLEAQAEREGLSVSNLTRVRHGLEPLVMGGKRPNTGRPPKAKAETSLKVGKEKGRKK
jgi:hypothetical protein